MLCPACQSNDGYKQQETQKPFAFRFFCPRCMFSCWLKHYRAQFNKDLTNNNK